MSKLKITQQQYNTILLREQESRLNSSGPILNENLMEGTQLLEEGWGDVVLGIAMMLGVGLTGQNKIMAQNAVKNDATMSQIKATLEDENKIDELVDALKEKGMKDPETKLAQNAEKVVDAYNRIASDDNIKYKVDVKVVNNLQALKGMVGSGYALKTDLTTTDVVNQDNKGSKTISITDTLEVDLGSDNLFVTGGYTLSPSGIDTLTIIINEIKKQGGKIEVVEIESSTDAERTPKFMSNEDPTGNIQLANLRTQSVTNLISSLNNVNITHREIPNNGSHNVSTQDFIKASKDHKTLVSLREKTKEFRYVKLKIIATFESVVKTTDDPVLNVVKNYRFELVKVIESTGKTRNIRTNAHFDNKKFKCVKKKLAGKIVDSCTTF